MTLPANTAIFGFKENISGFNFKLKNGFVIPGVPGLGKVKDSGVNGFFGVSDRVELAGAAGTGVWFVAVEALFGPV